MHPVEARLTAEGFTRDASLDHNDLIPFVAQYLLRKNRITLAWLILTLLFLCGWIASGLHDALADNIPVTTLLLWSLYGLLLTIVLIPIHEAIHGIAYRWCGAASVTYRANWRQLYFMAVADGFVAGRRPFYLVGVLPFILISTALAAAALYAGPELRTLLLTMLWLHSTMCAGDIGLMSYFEEHRHREVVTFDDVHGAVAYFLSRPWPGFTSAGLEYDRGIPGSH